VGSVGPLGPLVILSKLGTYKTVKARFWPWLEPLLQLESMAGFFTAVEAGKTDEVIRIIADGVDVDVKDGHGATALHLAAIQGHAGE